MLKPIRLFSILLLLALSFPQELQKQLTLKVKVQEEIKVQKPPIYVPDKLSYRVKQIERKNLLGRLLEPPKELEEAPLYVPKEGGCGAPKDLNLYKKGVENYVQGKLLSAEKALKDLLAIPGSQWAEPGKYVLGLIYYKTGREEEALRLFEEACNSNHIYTQPACESFYALYFKLFKKPYKTSEPLLWRYVYLIGAKNRLPERPIPDCSRYTFKNYCRYVNDFILGRENVHYPESTLARKALKLYLEGKLDEAKKILLKLKDKLLPYRDVIIYYLALIELEQGNVKKAIDYALLLESMNPELAQSLYRAIFVKNPDIADYVYEKTKDPWVYKFAGIKAYNEGRYEEALRYFVKAGDYLYAAYSAIRLGDYEKAYELLQKVQKKDREYYALLLEVLYKLGKDEEMLKVLSEIQNLYPDLWREYYGWYLFKQKRWDEAKEYFQNPYYRAIALFNAGKYEEVIEELKGDDSYEARILKAKAAIALGKGGLARRFLYNETPEEIYLTGLSYFIEGNYRASIPYFEKIVNDEEFGTRALTKLADAYYNLGEKEKARTLYKLILQKHKDSKEALIGIAQIEAENPSGELEKIVKELQRKNPKSPLLPELQLKLAELYAKEGRKVEAEFILRKLVNNPEYRERAMLLLARVTDDKREKEKILLNLLKSKDKLIREEAFRELSRLYEEEGELLKLARLLERRSDKEKIKAIEIYLKLGKVREAERLFSQLVKKYPKSEELKELALKLYEKTKKLSYLKLAYTSTRPEVFLKASYYLGVYYYDKDKKKALDYLLEVVLSDRKDLPFYKRAVFLSAQILKSMGAKKDASCILEKLKGLELESWEREKVLELKKGLPPCGG
ncbi:MAG: tetratricopeptide repeat protein [Aquificae bacterium]|nr:tetratricopeptide repeat protein [Aquificota bacterium]